MGRNSFHFKYIAKLHIYMMLMISCMTYCQEVMASRYALIIGIESYNNGVPALNGPKIDAHNMKDFLLSFASYREDEIQLLIDEQATRDNILAQLDLLSRNTGEIDEVLIYFSGHGSQVADRDNDEEDRLDETIVPVDTVLENKKYLNMITDDEIRQKLAAIRANKIDFIIDSCHSGTVTRSIGGGEGNSAVKTLFPELDTGTAVRDTYEHRRKELTFVNEGREQRVSVWTAASATQLAFTDIETRKGSLFTNRLIKGLSEGVTDFNRDGVTTNVELLEYLQDESAAFCKRNKKMCTMGLTPTYEATAEDYTQPVSFFEKPEIADEPGDSLFHYVNAVTTHKNSDEIFVTLSPSEVIRVGQKIRLHITAPFTGYLFLLDLNSRGELTQLYPNKYSRRQWERPLKKGEEIAFPASEDPFDFIASTPLGQGHLITVVVEDKLRFIGLREQNMSLEKVTDKETYLIELAYSLRKINTSQAINKRTRWSVNTLSYTLIQ